MIGEVFGLSDVVLAVEDLQAWLGRLLMWSLEVVEKDEEEKI